MSLRQGLELISGAGSSPYINKTTGNWEICGIDTGVPATHTKITVNEYNELIRTGNYDNSKMYFITDATPKVFINKQVLSSNWTQVGTNRYTNTISIPNVSSNTYKHTFIYFLRSSRSYMKSSISSSDDKNPFLITGILFILYE